MSLLFDGPIHVHYGQFYLTPSDAAVPEPPEAFAGQANGLCGAAVASCLFLVTGLHTGPVHVRARRLEAAPDEDDPAWEDAVEVSLTVGTVPVALEEWGGGARHALPLAPGAYRVRYRCRDMDAGQALDTPATDDALGPDRYELLFWPAPPRPDAVLRTGSEAAAYWHGAWGGRR